MAAHLQAFCLWALSDDVVVYIWFEEICGRCSRLFCLCLLKVVSMEVFGMLIC